MSDTDTEKPTDRSSTARPTWSISVFRKYAPFFIHLALTILVATLVRYQLHGRAFNANYRQPIYYESDGSQSILVSHRALQSDITTAVSLAATATRVAAGLWAGGYIWRSIFVSMERGGISLKGVERAISWIPPGPRQFKRRSNMCIIFIVLLATFVIQFFSAILIGSVTWEAASMLVPGYTALGRIFRGVNGTDLEPYYASLAFRNSVLSLGVASANLAWDTVQPTSAYSTNTSATTFKRVVRSAEFLPVNSTLNRVIVPYFAVDDFQWVNDPDSILTNQQKLLFSDNSEFSPYAYGAISLVAFLPDEQWGPPAANQLGDPHTVSETRLLSTFISRLENNGTCGYGSNSNDSQINLYQVQAAANMSYASDCFAIANVTYRAGVALCSDCPLVSPTIVQLDVGDPQPNATMLPDSVTSMALGLAPYFGTWLTSSNNSIPQNYGTFGDAAIELVSRAYQAAWGACSDRIGDQEDTTDVQISIPVLLAIVIPWRVYLWVGLHLLVLVLGLLFVYTHSRCGHPWVEDPTMAVFWLDTGAISGSHPNGDPRPPGTEPSRDGMLTLENESEGPYSMKVIKSQ